MNRILIRAATAALLVLGASGTHAGATEIVVGKPAPAFSLPDPNGKTVSLAEQQGKWVVLEWTNPECPFVRKHYGSGNMQKLQDTYTAKGVVWLSVASSAPGKEGNYPPDQWIKVQKDRNAHPTALLLDPDGRVGRAYGAKTTPHMFVIDPTGTLVYQGAIDDHSSPFEASISGAKNYVAAALDEGMSGKPVSTASTKPYGCSVKY
jgi:alkyl hydroperoxide reductase subunit AhpC